MKLTKKAFGTTKDGAPVESYSLTNGHGICVEVLTYGGVIRSIQLPGKNNTKTDVVLGFDTVSDYENQTVFIGAMIGRCANRIAKSQFSLHGTLYHLAANDGRNHLHGGRIGFDKRVWTATPQANGLVLSLESPHGEEGYPGTLSVTITYVLTEDNALELTYEATTDQPTVVNLTNHSYFNLAGHDAGSALSHTLQLFADQYTENDAESLPTGVIASVDHTPMDFRTAKSISRDMGKPFSQLQFGHGYDHNWIVPNWGTLQKIAVLQDPKSGRRMEVETTMPGLQFYSGNFLTPSIIGKHHTPYKAHQGVCLETQFYPNALEHPEFPSPVLLPETHYRHQTIYRFFP